MKDLYAVAGITKQALWKHKKRQEIVDNTTRQIVKKIKDIRKRHKRMGCRHMYFACNETLPVGRDAFEQIGLANGFRVKRKRNAMKTTWSQRVEIYPNLVEGLTINGINQVWQSDMFYIKIEGQNYYGVTIMDVYSRKLLALHISKSLSAVQLKAAMKKALKARSGQEIRGCIFHSDRGSQYISSSHKKLLNDQGIKSSMCLVPQENAYVERVHGTMKYDYLEPFELREKNLRYMMPKIIRYYNQERPHSSLNMMTPDNFEHLLAVLPENLRPEMTIYKWDHEISTKTMVINKKKKEAKKKKSTQILILENQLTKVNLF
jgi:transposase InsO family protein